MRLGIGFLSLFFLVLGTVPGLALEIVYPADKTFVTRSNFLILKGGKEPTIDGMIVGINGVKSDPIDISAAEYRAAFADMLILEPEFSPGRNSIVVEGQAGGKTVATAKAEIYFLADPMAAAPAGFSPFVMHLPEREKLCAPCHNMRPAAAALAAAGEANACYSCHKRMMNATYVHGPAGVWNCTYCHPADSKPARYQARPGDARVCQECHAEKVREFQARKFVHGPIEAGMCVICHDPHASEHRGQLRQATNTVCLACHDAISGASHVVRGVSGKGHPLSGAPDRSRAGGTLSCASCHNPHAGEATALFQRGISNRFALCQLCHVK